MEALNLLTLWQTDDEEDSFFDIDFTVPIKRKNYFPNKQEKVQKSNILEEVPMFSLIANATSPSNSSKRFSNNVVRKYMKLIKPLYSKASKIKFTDEVLVMEKKSPLREVCKQLRKSSQHRRLLGWLWREEMILYCNRMTVYKAPSFTAENPFIPPEIHLQHPWKRVREELVFEKEFRVEKKT